MFKEPMLMETIALTARRPNTSALERVLPALGGTVTEILERHLGEPLRAIRLEQRTTVCSRPVHDLALGVGESVLERRVILRAATSSAAVLYAESLVALDRLDPRFKEGLLGSDKPIGRLIQQYRVEIFRELLSHHRACNEQVAALFGVPPETPLLTRTYRMSSRGAPIMLITEWFAC
jgi:chorismate-pyruvate lyase